ncbi:hypothetical protein V6N11_025316 [Hibiscus sabdariffa]|uniref:Uncharacterized protein n=1 Tax=Hibiscus sabdariffa TaxID=183260 RepID=A0ABR1ZE11_9ROSI
MSKKKAFSGNTMTLKDFHGGLIPTDLPLPSAPGVSVRPSDRSGYDRATSWGNSLGRPDHRDRPNSSPATRHLDNKTPFLTNSVHIGRNFDEDERTPLDGVSAPRRTISDESFRVPAPRRTISDESFWVPARHVELKSESAYAGRVSGRHGSAPVSPLSNVGGHSYSSRVSEAAHIGLASQASGWNHGQAALGSYPNAWTSRKEVTLSVPEPVQSAWSEQSAVSKLAHASALEKVSSGRWQSKQFGQNQKDIEVSKHSEMENGFYFQGYGDKMYSRMSFAGGREFSDVTLARHVEKGYNIDKGIHDGRKELPDYERNHSLIYLEVKENKSMVHGEGVRSTHSDGKLSGYELQSLSPVLPEASEGPKLKLLPQTKPLDVPKSPVVEPKQGNQQQTAPVLSHTGIVNLNVPVRPYASYLLANDRNLLFGGARPRELVLKERGIDDSNHESLEHLDRVKHNVMRTEKAADQAAPLHGERVESHPVDQRGGRKTERDRRVDNGRVVIQRRNWRNENRRNGWETERQQQQQQQQPAKVRQPSPETWRKPAENTTPVSTRSAYRKLTSAVELAQAFSKSFSDQKTDDQYGYGGQRGTLERTQMPFSRLMGPTPRPEINGY